MDEPIRRARFTPYRKGMGPTFALTLWDADDRPDGRYGLRYRLNMLEGSKSETLFEGSDFGCSPLNATDSDETVAALMGFLTLRPGDTDADYFDDYTDAQKEYCEQHAETLGCEVSCRFGEEG